MRKKNFSQNRQDEKKEYRPAAFVSKERPISMAQVTHMSPKKFKEQRKKNIVNLEEVRNLINETKK